MNFFQNFWSSLKPGLQQIGTQELGVLAPALGNAVAGIVANPTHAGLVTAGLPAVAQIAVTQPSMITELIQDLTVAILQAADEKTSTPAAPATPAPTSPAVQAGAAKLT